MEWPFEQALNLVWHTSDPARTPASLAVVLIGALALWQVLVSIAGYSGNWLLEAMKSAGGAGIAVLVAWLMFLSGMYVGGSLERERAMIESGVRPGYIWRDTNVFPVEGDVGAEAGPAEGEVD